MQDGTLPEADISPPWSRPGRYVGAAILVLISLAALLFIRPIGSTLVLALLLVVLMNMVTRLLARVTHIRYQRAMILGYLGLVIVLVLAFFVIVPRMLDWTGQLFGVMTPVIEAILATLPPPSSLATELGLQHFLQLLALVAQSMIAMVQSELSSAQGYGQVVVFGAFLSFLMLIDLGEQGLRLLSLLPVAHRRDARLLGARTGTVWLGWLKATLIFDALVAAASAVMFHLLGVPFPWLMTLVAAIVVLIPVFGAFLASFIIAIPCFFLGSTVFTEMPGWAFALLIIIVFNLVVGGLYYAVCLPVMGKKTQLPVSVVLIGVLASFSIGSLWVAFVLVPLVATVRIIFSYLLAKTRQVDPFPPEALAGSEDQTSGLPASNKPSLTT